MRTELIRTLTAEIKTLSQRSRELKALIKEKKHDTWREQAALLEVRKDIRNHHRAVAFLKGVPYAKVESNLKKPVHLGYVMPLLRPLLGSDPVKEGEEKYEICLEWNAWVEDAVYHISGQATFENKFLHYAGWYEELTEDLGAQITRRALSRLKDYLIIEVTENIEENTEEVTPC